MNFNFENYVHSFDFVSFIGLFPNQETKHWRKKSQFVNMGKNIWKSYELYACLSVKKDWFVPISILVPVYD